MTERIENGRAGMAVLTIALAVICASPALAQTPNTAATNSGSVVPSPAPQHVQTHSHKKKAAKTAPPPVETHPPDPPPPDWPVNDEAKPASVAWNGRDLSIAASNSSLQQILHDVSTATGVKVEGLSTSGPHDQRIYGSYGPAPARDVLSQLLDGSGYNVIMVGDRGEGTPRELVLTAQIGNAKTPAPAAHQLNQNDDDAPDEPEPEPQPEPQRQPFNVPAGQPGPGRTPQQMMQEIQQRQQQQLQQQQQQPQQQPQQNNPPGAPPNAPPN
jgi:hypothetical protein